MADRARRLRTEQITTTSKERPPRYPLPGGVSAQWVYEWKPRALPQSRAGKKYKPSKAEQGWERTYFARGPDKWAGRRKRQAVNRYIAEPRPWKEESYGLPPWLVEQGTDWLNECTGQRYSKTPMGVTFQDGVELVRQANEESGGGYRSPGSVLWAMRTIKLRRWFDEHEQCPEPIQQNVPHWAAWTAMVEGEERLRAGWTLEGDKWVEPGGWSALDEQELAAETFGQTAELDEDDSWDQKFGELSEKEQREYYKRLAADEDVPF